MTKSETAWVAGILEGEACFDFNRKPKYPRIRIEMSDLDVIDRLQDLIGGRVTYPRVRRGHHRPTAMLSVNGQTAKSVMRAVLPWMGERRAAKIHELLESSE